MSREGSKQAFGCVSEDWGMFKVTVAKNKEQKEILRIEN